MELSSIRSTSPHPLRRRPASVQQRAISARQAHRYGWKPNADHSGHYGIHLRTAPRPREDILLSNPAITAQAARRLIPPVMRTTRSASARAERTEYLPASCVHLEETTIPGG